MALEWANNVVEASTTTTTGAYQLAGVPASGEPPGTQTFVAGIGNGNTCYYYASEDGGSAYEEGLGTVTDAATDTLTRTTVYRSSNANAAVDWTGKTLRVRCVLPAASIAAFLDTAHISADDHTQYALLAGRTTGQSLTGGANASATLTLASTSNATKGKLLFGNSAYDEVNNRLGIGTAAPASEVHVVFSKQLQPRGITVDQTIDGVFGGSILLRHQRGATGALIANDSLGAVAFSGYDGTSYQEHQGIIQVKAAENFVAGANYGTNMVFQLIKKATGYAVYTPMTLTSEGFLGVGVETPYTKLQLGGADAPMASASSGILAVGTGEGSSAPHMLFGVDTAPTETYGWIGAVKNGSTWANIVLNSVGTGKVGIGVTSPTAKLHIKAGTATANTAPLKFTTGTLNTTAEAGALEYNNTPWFTNSDATRRSIVLSDGTYTAGSVAVGGTIKMNINGTNYNVHVS